MEMWWLLKKPVKKKKKKYESSLKNLLLWTLRGLCGLLCSSRLLRLGLCGLGGCLLRLWLGSLRWGLLGFGGGLWLGSGRLLSRRLLGFGSLGSSRLLGSLRCLWLGCGRCLLRCHLLGCRLGCWLVGLGQFETTRCASTLGLCQGPLGHQTLQCELDMSIEAWRHFVVGADVLDDLLTTGSSTFLQLGDGGNNHLVVWRMGSWLLDSLWLIGLLCWRHLLFFSESRNFFLSVNESVRLTNAFVNL